MATVPQKIGYSFPTLNLTRAQANDPLSVYKALHDFSQDLQTWLQRAVASINLNNRGAFQKNGSGFFEINSGYLVQWGSTTASSAGVTTNFPTAFPTACGAVLLQQQGNASPAADTLAAQIVSTTQFKSFSSAAGPVNCSFLAVGN